MKTTLVTALSGSIASLLAALPAGAQSTHAELQQAVAEYRKSNSVSKAEKVIKMAAAMEQLPPIPEEARKHFVRGTALFNDAKSPDDNYVTAIMGHARYMAAKSPAQATITPAPK
jgi:hypothetical protein